jgi:two-component system sensor histidine kinase BaeS
MLMRFGVKQKLLFAMLGATVVATVAMALASQLGFKRGFLDYLNDQGVTRLEAVLPSVAQLYSAKDGWGLLRKNARPWFVILGIPGGPGGPSGPGGPPPAPGGAENFPMDNVDLSGIGVRIALLDERHQFIIGPSAIPKNSVERAVIVGGKAVGWLALVPLQYATGAADLRFQSRQLWLTWSIGALAIVAAAMVAALLADAFLAPVKRIAESTRQLAAGNYATRVESGSHDEIGQLASDVNHLALALERNESLRRNLMADVSHELRTPVAVLRAELEAIDDGIRKPSPESVKSLLTEVNLLGKLVNDVHDLAIADVGALSYRKLPVNVAAVLGSCVSAFQDRFEHEQLRVERHEDNHDMLVLADENRLAQLFTNLLENSVRYTDAGGVVRVSYQRTGDSVHVRIEDSTPGVAAEALPHLFERFYRASGSRSRSVGGSGLGLAICRSIVEAHGGTIVATSSAFGGLCIDVKLPALA